MMARLVMGLALLAPAAFGATAGEWTLRLQGWQSEALELPGAPAEDTDRRLLHAAWQSQHAGGRTRVSYEHQPLLIRTGDPATNGYLHQVDVRHATRLGDVRLDVSLGVHGSSNIFTHQEFRSDVLVGGFRALHPIPGPFDAVGLAGDYRFGEFLVYPRLTATAALGGTELLFDLPPGATQVTAGALRWNATASAGRRWTPPRPSKAS